MDDTLVEFMTFLDLVKERARSSRMGLRASACCLIEEGLIPADNGNAMSVDDFDWIELSRHNPAYVLRSGR